MFADLDFFTTLQRREQAARGAQETGATDSVTVHDHNGLLPAGAAAVVVGQDGLGQPFSESHHGFRWGWGLGWAVQFLQLEQGFEGLFHNHVVCVRAKPPDGARRWPALVRRSYQDATVSPIIATANPPSKSTR